MIFLLAYVIGALLTLLWVFSRTNQIITESEAEDAAAFKLMNYVSAVIWPLYWASIVFDVVTIIVMGA